MLNASCFIDHADATVHPVHTDSSDRRPYIFVQVSDDLSLWGHHAAKFRCLASKLLEAADALERAAESMRTAAQDDAERVAQAMADCGVLGGPTS